MQIFSRVLFRSMERANTHNTHSAAGRRRIVNACTVLREPEARDALIQMRLACVSPPKDRKLARRACNVTRIRCPGVRLSRPDTSTKGHAPILFPPVPFSSKSFFIFRNLLRGFHSSRNWLNTFIRYVLWAWVTQA